MNHNIRKRRAYCPEDDTALAEPSLSALAYPSPSVDSSTLPLSGAHRYILEQAPSTRVSITTTVDKLLEPDRPDNQHFFLEQVASATNWSLPILLDLSSGQPRSHKKPRLDTSSYMSGRYIGNHLAQNGQEKSPHANQPGPSVNASLGPYGLLPDGGVSSGWTGSRLADCFASFSMCPPCSDFEPQPPYQPLPVSSSYGYDSIKPPELDPSMACIQSREQASLAATPVAAEPTGLLPCDDPGLVTQYLSGYPPLQPAQVMGIQPAASREAMVYPKPSPVAGYDVFPNGPGGSTESETQVSFITSSTPPTGTLPCAYASSLEPSSYEDHTSRATIAPSFHSLQGYDSKGGTGSSGGGQEGPAIFDFFPPHKPLPAKRGPFRDQDQREKTARTRKMGSCIRCRMQRIRCNLDPDNEKGPCLSCKKIATTTRIYRLSCLRWKITDVKLLKPGQVREDECKWTDRWKDSVMDEIRNWESSRVRIIHVTEGYTGKSIRLRVRQFQPQVGDRLKRSWMSPNGQKKEVEIPPYAIVDMEDTKAALSQYIKHGLLSCCNSLLGARDKLLWKTYALAMKAAMDSSTSPAEKNLLLSTLDLWMSVRLTTKSFEIVGDDTLDMPADMIKDRDSPLYGKIPLPPVMGAQLDSVLIHQIQPQLRRRTLEELQKMTQEKKQKTWLTTYLVTFILLHNIALITKHDAEYAKKHGMKRRFAREASVREYNLGANTLLAYFHYCNKAIYPFSDECKDEDLQSLAELDDEAISFVHFVRRFVAEHKREWEALWLSDAYEHEYYYVSQLFERNWQPRIMP